MEWGDYLKLAICIISMGSCGNTRYLFFLSFFFKLNEESLLGGEQGARFIQWAASLESVGEPRGDDIIQTHSRVRGKG